MARRLKSAEDIHTLVKHMGHPVTGDGVLSISKIQSVEMLLRWAYSDPYEGWVTRKRKRTSFATVIASDRRYNACWAQTWLILEEIAAL